MKRISYLALYREHLPALTLTFFVSVLLLCSLVSCLAQDYNKPSKFLSMPLKDIEYGDLIELDSSEQTAYLKDELLRQIDSLEKSGFVSKTAESMAISGLQFSLSNNSLSWEYKNLGDYDLNGEVGIPDVTPIALNYLASTDDMIGNDFLESLADGNGDGEVGIPDITPIAENYGHSISNFEILHSASENSPWNVIALASATDIVMAEKPYVHHAFNGPVDGFVKVQAIDASSAVLSESEPIKVYSEWSVELNEVAVEGRINYLSSVAESTIGTCALISTWDLVNPVENLRIVSFESPIPQEVVVDTSGGYQYIGLATDLYGYPIAVATLYEDIPLGGFVAAYSYNDWGWDKSVYSKSEYHYSGGPIMFNRSNYAQMLVWGPVGDADNSGVNLASFGNGNWEIELIERTSNLFGKLALDNYGFPHVVYSIESEDSAIQVKYASKDKSSWNHENVVFFPGWFDSNGVGKKVSDIISNWVSYEVAMGGGFNPLILLEHSYGFDEELIFLKKDADSWQSEHIAGNTQYSRLNVDRCGYPLLFYYEWDIMDANAIVKGWNGNEWISHNLGVLDDFGVYRAESKYDSDGILHLFYLTRRDSGYLNCIAYRKYTGI